jgi:hypothetical protein
MADFSGAVLSLVFAISTPGRLTGLAFPPAREPGVFNLTFPAGGAAFELDGVPGVPARPQTNRAGVIVDPQGSIWFGRVHALPRSIDFGNILTAVTRTFELHNASGSSATVSSVLNDPNLGITLPDTTFPLTLGPYGTTLDPSLSARLVPVGARMIAGPVGLATFDTQLVFSAGGSVPIAVTGIRTVVVLAPWDGGSSGVREIMSWRTAITEMGEGAEQRVSIRSFPRQIFRGIEWRLDGNERRRHNIVIEQLHGLALGLAIWTEQMRITAAASAGVLTLTVDSTTDVDLRIGELAVVYSSPNKFDVLTVSSKTATSVTFTSVTLSAYSVGDYVMPIRVGRLSSRVGGDRFPVTVQDATADFEVDDNHTGAQSASTAGWSTLDGKVFFDDCNFMDGDTVSEARERKLRILDSNTGIVTQSTRWTRDKRTHVKGFRARTRAELMKLRRLFLALRGRQVSFKIPTFAEDLLVTQTATSGTNVVTVENVGFTRYVGQGRQIRFTFTDATTLVRTVTASSELSSTEEQLTLNTTWPATRTAAEFQRAEFIELVRSDTDDLEIQHGIYVGDARVTMPVKQVTA